MGLTLEVIDLILTIVAVVGISIAIPVLLRIKTLLLELLQSIVGKVEDDVPFIHGVPPDESEPRFLADAVAKAEQEGLDNGTFRGHVPWEPPPGEKPE